MRCFAESQFRDFPDACSVCRRLTTYFNCLHILEWNIEHRTSNAEHRIGNQEWDVATLDEQIRSRERWRLAGEFRLCRRDAGARAPERARGQSGGSPLLCGEEPCGIEP
jgi:hypothetical protein